MKVVFVNRADCFTKRGGDTNQMLLTKKYLESVYHLDITICLSPEELLTTKCDIVHIFNIQTTEQSLEYIKIAIRKNIKIAVTPIYWNLGYGISYYGLTKLKLIKPRKIYPLLNTPIISFATVLKKNAYLSNHYRTNINYIFKNTDIILPNSPEEFEIICNHFNVPSDINCKIVPNAIELPEKVTNVKTEYQEKIIVQAGRISAVKNQAGTLLALFDQKDIPLYFIGKVEDLRYYNYLKRKADKRGNVFFIDEVSSDEITDFYKNAAVHVLPSFRESPGLVSLEAFYHGCEIVVSDARFSPVNYYQFNEIAHVCNPFNVLSITAAIKDALNNPKQGVIDKSKYFSFFNYNTVAEKTYKAYQKISNG